jgi:hypothetical protein
LFASPIKSVEKHQNKKVHGRRTVHGQSAVKRVRQPSHLKSPEKKQKQTTANSNIFD